jgi:predicted enzyme related to lactoylglutathione lyase
MAGGTAEKPLEARDRLAHRIGGTPGLIEFRRTAALPILRAGTWGNRKEKTIMACVRYIVDDVDEAVAFYRDLLDFTVEMHNPSKFAALWHGDLRLLLNAPGAGSAGKAGGHPRPGGWCRFQIETRDLDDTIARLRKAGASFRGDIAEADAGRQILLEDPSGNVIELFEYARQTA